MAHAAGKNDKAARARGDQAIDEHYLAMNLKQAEAELKGAVQMCQGGKCSPEVEATLRRDLAMVYLAGKKQRQGNEQMQQAIKLHPALQLNPDLTTDDVRAAYQQAGGIELKGEPPPSKEEPKDVTLEEEVDTEDVGSGEATKHWVSGGLQIDYMLHKETDDACTSGGAYFCYKPNGERYGFTAADPPIREGLEGNRVEGGLALATVRLLLGYDYHLLPSLMVGGRLGFAFRGAPVDPNADQQSFMPLHVEVRVQRLLLDKPFTFLTPYVGAAAGMAQVDSGVPVDFYVEGGDPNLYTMAGYRKTGKGFLSLSLGTYYQATPQIAPFAELTFMQMIPVTAQVFAIRVGVAYGGLDLPW